MKSEPIDDGGCRLSFEEPEAYFLFTVLSQLAHHYGEDYNTLPPAQRTFWRGTLTSRPELGHEMREGQEMLTEARAELRSARLALAQEWIEAFERTEARDPWVLEIGAGERDELAAMLNDRRLLLALEIGLHDHELALPPGDVEDESRRMAVMEIDLLGYILMGVLGPQSDSNP